MRKFKNKTTGIVGQLKEDGHLHFERGDERTTCHESIWFGFVENSCDWEEVVEKDYEILSFTGGGDEEVYIKGKDGIFRSTLDNVFNDFGNWRTEEHMLSKDVRCEIFSVKRFRDGEVFKIGDNFTFMHGDKVRQIKGIYIRDENPWLQFDLNNPTYGATLEYAKKVKQPLFTTEDGVDIFEGDVSFGVNSSFKLSEVKHINKLYVYSGVKEFSTKEKAEEYILFNKPCLSLNDLLDAWGNVDDRECYKQSILFNNYKKTAQNKIKNE